MKATSSFVA